MKKTIFLILFIVLSCNRSLDQTDIDSVSRHTIQLLNSGNLQALEAISEIDSLDSNLGRGVKSNLQRHIDKLSSTKNLDIIDYKIYKQKKKYKDIYGKVVGEDSVSTEYINYYFKIDTIYYEMHTSLKKKGRLYYYNSLIINNLNDECDFGRSLQEMIFQTGIDSSIKFKSIYWRPSFNKDAFKEFHIRGYNSSKYAIQSISFKLVLYRTDINEKFFSKTITEKIKVEPDNSFQIEIDELKDYFTGFKINKNSLSWTTEIVNAVPANKFKIKPERSCNLLDSLRN